MLFGRPPSAADDTIEFTRNDQPATGVVHIVSPRDVHRTGDGPREQDASSAVMRPRPLMTLNGARA